MYFPLKNSPSHFTPSGSTYVPFPCIFDARQLPEYVEPSAECAAVAGLRKVGWKRAGLSLQSRPLQLSAVDKSPLRGAWVCLHVRSAAAAYGDLGKTRVTPSRALTKAIAAAVEQALREP